jgi:hypothetical protein
VASHSDAVDEESGMKVWIMERDHKPMVNSHQHVLSFPVDAEGTAAMKKCLNMFPASPEHGYYDAVLYERIEPGPKFQNLESEK